MGSMISPAPIDSRIEKVMNKFRISKGKISELWVLFCRHGQEHSGKVVMTTIIFLQDLLKYPPSPLTDAFPVFFDTSNDGFLLFGEFVEIVCQFCFFEQMDLMRYIFNILDPERRGRVEKTIFRHFFVSIWRNKPYDCLREAMEYLDKIDDSGSYSYEEFVSLRNTFPLLFYPMYALQNAIIANSFGEFWWTHHKAFYLDDLQRKQKKLRAIEERQKVEAQKKEFLQQAIIEEDMVRERMGLLFYLTPWRRALERRRVARIAAWEEELDQMIEDIGLHSENIVKLASLSKTKSTEKSF